MMSKISSLGGVLAIASGLCCAVPSRADPSVPVAPRAIVVASSGHLGLATRSRRTGGASGSRSSATARSASAERIVSATAPSDPFAAHTLDDAALGQQRGGAESTNQNNAVGSVAGNVASQLTTGSNSISDGAFSNSSGIPIVIQNSGNNVLIQNSTILNLQLTPAGSGT